MEATAQHVDHELEMLWQTYLSSRDKADLLQYVKRFMFYYEAHNPKEIGPFNVGIEQSTDQYQQLGKDLRIPAIVPEGLMESVVSELVSLELVKVKDEKVTLVYVIDLLRICKVLFRYIPAHVEAISGSSSAVGIQIIIDLIQNWFSEKIILNHSDLQEPLLLLLESVVSSFQENAVQVISPVVIEGLFDVLSYFSPGNISDGSFNVVLYCFTRVVHSLHASSLQQCQVDVPSILNRFLDLLDTRDDVCLTDDEVQFKISLLECIPVMLDCTDSPVLQAIFIGIRGLEKVIAATEKLVNDRPSALQNKLCCVCLHATMAILKHSDPAKKQEVFKASVGYDRLRNLLAAVKQPSCELIHTVFCMMLEGNVKTDNRLIENSAVVLFVLDWLPYLPQEQQRYLAQCLVSLCLHSPFNQMTCCEAGIISKIISFLDGKEELDAKLKLIFISLLEVFGAYSITAGELKQLLSLFQPSNQEKKVLCSNRLMQAIARMAAGSGIEKTLNYFDFHHQTAGIKVPCISRWGGHGFSFHVWVCLEPLSEESSGSSLQGWRCRRQLYSFLTAHSTGFEGFFTDEGHLVIAVVTRKEFLTSVVLSTNLYDGQWHCLDIVHTGSRNPFGHSQLLAFIDGSQKLSSQLKFPNISEPFVSCHIGLPGCQTMRHRNKPQKKFSFQKLTHLADPAISSSLLSKFPPCIAVGTQNDVWGVPISLQGLLASVCVFNETMQETHVTELWQAGPNTLSVFEGADLSSDQENSNSVGSYGCSDLANRLVLYYNAKACHDSICTDLTPRSPGQPVLNGSLTGQKCKTWDIKETINCIGGIQVLLPILEQVEYDPNMSVIDTVEVDEIDADLLTASDVFIDTEVETTSDTKLLKSPSNVSLPRSVSSSSSSDMYLPVEIAQNDNGWIVVDNQVQVRRHSHRGRTNPLEDRVENNGVVAFFYLLKNMIKGSLVNQEILVKAHIIETIGAILEVKDHRFIDVNVLMSIQSLVEAVAPANRTLLNLVYRHLLFNFQIWSYSEFPVRIGHMQYLSTLIKDNPEQLRETFGVQYILNVIRIHYTTSEDLSPKVNSSRNPSVLQDNESRIIRAAHLGLIKYYLKSDARPEEVSSLVNFMAGADDENMLTDLLEMLVTVTSRSTGKLLTKLSEPQNTALLLMLVAGPYEENIKLKVLRILYKVLGSDRIPSSNKSNLRLKEIGFTGLTASLSGQQCSESLIKALLQLAVTDFAGNKLGIDVFGDFDIVLAVVDILQVYDIRAKLDICQLLLRSLNACPFMTQHCAKQPSWYNSFFRLITQPLNQGYEGRSEETVQEIEALVQSALQIVFLVLWKGVEGYSDDAWLERGQAITAISTITSTEEFMQPSKCVERQLMELCVRGAIQDIKISGQTGVSETKNALQVMRLIEDFLFVSASMAGSDDHEEEFKWSIKLVSSVVELLEALNVWDDSEGNTEWAEMGQIGTRILLGFIARPETEFCATASSKLCKLLGSRTIHSQGEISFVLGNIYQAFLASRNKDKCQNYSFIVPVLRLLLNKYREKLPLNSYIPSFPAPDTGHSKFDEELLRITSTEEFAALMKQQIFPSMKQFEANIEDASMDSGRFWMQCLNKLNSSMQEKEEAVERSIKKFQEQIKQPFELLQKQERSQFKIYIKQEKQAHALTLRQWSAAKKYFTSERGAWASRASEPVHWKLSTSENFSRMRLKLTRNYKFDPHKEASAMRDNALAVDGVDGEITIPAVAKEAVVQKLQDDQLDQENWDAFITNTSPRNRSETLEKDQPRTVLEVDCEIITLMDHIPGTFRVTHNHVYFTHTDENGQDPGVQDFKWTLSQLREVHLRRYNLRRSALEFFLIDQTSYFINFTKETRNVVYWKIMTLKPANLYFSKARSPADLLKGSGLTEKWTRREISNFDYLMHLNTIAGRTYNDLSQYPVFPWILADYTSETLDLTNPAVFRDLSKPIGALNADRREELRERYNSFEDPSGVIRKFHYGTHYSNAASVLFFLLRVEPFTTLHIKLQSGRFDVADRQFHSLPEMWQSLVRNPSDVKELIPEFFYFPEMLENSNRFDLGTLQRGGDVDDVILPKWANSAWDFVNKHRQALESDYVSDHLHEWIDLIFGYKQKGPAAEEALNVFYYCTYEGAVDLDAISDAHEREVAEAMINNFGQTPSQLLIVPHPQRMNADQATEARAKLSGDKPLTSLFTNLEHIKKAYEVDVFSEHQPLVLVSVPRAQARSLIHHGMLDTMVTINQQGIIGAHGWLPYRTRTKHFTFEPDPSLSSSRSRRCVAPFLSPDLQVTSRLFLVTHDAKLVISCGHWDNSIRVFNIKGKLQSIIARHSNIVTCLALDDTGHHMISGSRDTTCMVWKIHHYAGMSCNVNTRPVHILYGHDDEVTCVVISWELDIAVSGSKDGTCCIHTVRKGQYVRTLRPIVEQQAAPQRTCEVRCLALSEDGNIVVYCKSNGQLSLTRYSINGKLLDVDFLTENIADMLIQGGYLIIGGQKGKLTFLNLHGLKKARKHMNMHSSICSLFMTTEHSHLLVGLMDGKLHIITSNST